MEKKLSMFGTAAHRMTEAFENNTKVTSRLQDSYTTAAQVNIAFFMIFSVINFSGKVIHGVESAIRDKDCMVQDRHLLNRVDLILDRSLSRLANSNFGRDTC